MPVQATTLVKAYATLTATADGDITTGENVVIGGKTYTWQALSSDGDVKYATAYADNLLALKKAINLDGDSGTDYDTAMTRNPYCNATVSAGVLTITARASGLSGNLVAITKGSSDIVLSDNNGALLASGAGQIDDAIDELQAGAQLNSDVLTFLAWMEV